MKSETFRHESTTNYVFTVHKYPTVVLVECTSKEGRRKSSTRYTLIPRKHFDLKSQKSMMWTLSVPFDKQFLIITPEYLEWYKAGAYWGYEKDGYEPKNKWKNILDIGDFSRVVRDQSGMDGYLYDLKGKTIPRSFFFSYIESYIRNHTHDLEKTTEWLKKQNGVSQVEIVEIPYYNVDSQGNRSIEFLFTPTPRFFAEIIKAQKTSYFRRDEIIRKKVNINKHLLPVEVIAQYEKEYEASLDW